MEEEKKKGERKERGNKEKEKIRKKKTVHGRERKRKRGKEKIFPMFRRSEHGPRTKVCPCNESYTWVLKSEFLVEAPRGRGFLLYRFLFI